MCSVNLFLLLLFFLGLSKRRCFPMRTGVRVPYMDSAMMMEADFFFFGFNLNLLEHE